LLPVVPFGADGLGSVEQLSALFRPQLQNAVALDVLSVNLLPASAMVRSLNWNALALMMFFRAVDDCSGLGCVGWLLAVTRPAHAALLQLLPKGRRGPCRSVWRPCVPGAKEVEDLSRRVKALTQRKTKTE
jgi:hypothetical protein